MSWNERRNTPSNILILNIWLPDLWENEYLLFKLKNKTRGRSLPSKALVHLAFPPVSLKTSSLFRDISSLRRHLSTHPRGMFLKGAYTGTACHRYGLSSPKAGKASRDHESVYTLPRALSQCIPSKNDSTFLLQPLIIEEHPLWGREDLQWGKSYKSLMSAERVSTQPSLIMEKKVQFQIQLASEKYLMWLLSIGSKHISISELNCRGCGEGRHFHFLNQLGVNQKLLKHGPFQPWETTSRASLVAPW